MITRKKKNGNKNCQHHKERDKICDWVERIVDK